MNPLSRLRPGPLDIHAHVVPDAFLTALASGERPGFGVETGADGRPRLVLAGQAMTPPVQPGMTSLELRFRAMDEQGVAAQLLSPWVALTAYHLGEADGIWFAERLNAAITDLVRAAPDRFLGLGSVPLQAPQRAADMLRWAVRDLGLLGVEIATGAGPERFLDDPALEPFWAEAEALRAFVMIHPSLGGTGRQFARYYLNNLIHNPLETTVAAAHLAFGGVMERHPDLRICLVHGGGYLPYALGRLVRGRSVRPETGAALRGSVEEAFHRFYFDTVTHSASALRFLVGEAGAEKVLLGSDYPFDMGDPAPVRTVRDAGLPAEAEALVLRGSAKRLFGRE